jgi:hypothetical protein
VLKKLTTRNILLFQPLKDVFMYCYRLSYAPASDRARAIGACNACMQCLLMLLLSLICCVTINNQHKHATEFCITACITKFT